MNKGFTLLELLIVVVILGILALLAAPILIDTVETSKKGVIRGNINAATSSVNSELATDHPPLPSEIASKVATKLNNDNKNPIDQTKPAFADHAEPTPGTVVISSNDTEETLIIQGYDKNNQPLLPKPKIVGTSFTR